MEIEPWIIGVAWGVSSIIALGLVSSIQIALTGLPEARIHAAVKNRIRGARGLSYWLEKPRGILATLSFLKLFFIVGAGVAGTMIEPALPWALPGVVVALIVSAVALVFGHFAPRSVAKRNPFDWSRHSISVLRVLTVVCGPIVVPLAAFARVLAKPFKGAPDVFWTHAELSQIATEARTDGLSAPAEELLSSIIAFSDTVIREIMVPRTEMVTIPVTSTVDEVRAIAQQVGHSRIPVYDENIDNIIGLLHVKELARTDSEELHLRRLLRPTFYVPEVMKISELLRDFQRRKTHLAIVVDEYGGTAGVVTLEDIIEEIVGEIQDEYDWEEKQIHVLSENKVIADARVSVWELNDIFAVDFPDHGFETLGGFLTFRAGQVPEPGAVLTWRTLRFTIKEADERHVARVEIERINKMDRPVTGQTV